jgi:hypothetical protein
MADEPRPKRPIRRFDVFAEYNKLRALREGRPLDEAKGYGLWLAKLVAGRGGGAGSARAARPADAAHAAPGPSADEAGRFRSLGGEEQTDERFDREVVARMGEAFYDEVFAPAIADHFERGERYEAIRDRVRKGWTPAR